MTLFGISVIEGIIRILRSHPGYPSWILNQNFIRRKKAVWRQRQRLQCWVPSLRNTRDWFLAATRKWERGVEWLLPQSPQREPPYQRLDYGHLSSLQNYQKIYLHCYKPPMLWKLQQPWWVNNTQGRWQAHCSAGSGQGVLWKNWKKPVQNQAGLLNVLLSRAAAHPTELL